MKKITISIFIIGCLLSTALINVSGTETISKIADVGVNAIQTTGNDFRERYEQALNKALCSPDPDSTLLKYGSTLFVPGEMIIKFKEEKVAPTYATSKCVVTGVASLDEFNAKYKVTLISESLENDIASNSKTYKFSVSDKNIDTIAMTEEYNRNPYVEFAELNYIYHFNLEPNDEYYNQQWALKKIEAPKAWDIETGDEDIVIAIIDTGVDYNHPDLADNIWVNEKEDRNHNGKFDNWPCWIRKNSVWGDLDKLDNDMNGYVDDVIGYDFVFEEENDYKGTNNPIDSYGHGTHCAGIAAAVTNNGIGIAGVAGNCKIMSLRVGDYYVDTWGAVDAIKYAADNGANVISMSWGSYSESHALEDAIDYAYNRGVVLISSAGNEKTHIKSYPAGYDNVIAVSATDINDERAYFSNFGSWIDVAAPGVDILSTMPTYDVTLNEYGYKKNYDKLSGTSMSCPHVAGLAALLLSKAKEENMLLDPIDVKTILHSSTDNINSDFYTGVGRINAYKALQKINPFTVELLPSLDDEEVQGKIQIEGKVDFSSYYYEVSYGRGAYPSNWIQITKEIIPAGGNIFVPWDTTKIEDGAITIRLRVTAKEQNYEDTAFLLINNKPGEILNVDDDSSKEYRHIQEAVNDAGEGDIVYVHGGTYHESVIICRSIILKGENRENTVLDGEGSEDNGIYIDYADKTQVSGFTVTRYCGGVLVLNSMESLVSNNIIKDNQYYGIQAASNNMIISDNIITGTHLPIGDGIVYALWQDNKITNNIIEKNEGNGIDISGIGGYIEDNIVKDNNYNGILLYMSTGPLSWETDPSDFIVCNNYISGNNLNGIYLNLDTYMNISNNFIKNNKRGIRLSFATNDTIYLNNITCNDEKGIFLTRFSIDDLEENHFLVLILGALLKQLTPVQLELFLRMTASADNNIFKNNVSESIHGVYIDNIACGRNTFYHNNFELNTQHAFDNSKSNYWYNSTIAEGNYWDDYDGEDKSGDGIGDTPYEIYPYPNINKDIFPLMFPYGHHVVNLPPNKPTTPTGPAQGKPGISYSYKTSTTDPEGDQIYYMWDWADGTTLTWIGPYNSGETCTASHSWVNKGTYGVKVKAKDEHDAESPWSDPLPTTMPFEPEELTAKLIVSPNNVITKKDCKRTFDASDSTPKDVLKGGPILIRWDYNGDGYDTAWRLFQFNNIKTIDLSYLFNDNDGNTNNNLPTGSNLPTGIDSSKIAKKFYFAKVQIMNSAGETSTASIQMTIDYTNSNNNEDTMPDQTQEETMDTAISIEQTITTNKPTDYKNPIEPTIKPVDPINPTSPVNPINLITPQQPTNPINPANPTNIETPASQTVNIEQPSSSSSIQQSTTGFATIVSKQNSNR